MSIITEVWRHSFPKNIRYCRQCQILHSCLYTISKKYKHKKYIPRSELQDLAATFMPMPGAPLTTLPIVRHILLVRFFNGIRVSILGKQSWLFTSQVAEEHAKLVRWLERDRKESAARNVKLEKLVDREKFNKEVLDVFHVAEMYHRMFRAGAAWVVILLTIIALELYFPTWFYLYCRWWKWMSEEDMRSYLKQVTEAHTLCEVVPAYAGKLPSPCVLVDKAAAEALCNNGNGDRGAISADGDNNGGDKDRKKAYCVNVAEFASPDGTLSIVFIPFPQIGTDAFFTRVGKILRACDVLLLEGVPMHFVSRLPPAMLLPAKVPCFPSFGVTNRYFDIIHNNTMEPPKLYPGATKISFVMKVSQALLPMSYRMVINPTIVSGTKGEAKIGWGRLREVIAEHEAAVEELRDEASSGKAQGKRAEIHTRVAVPWSVCQIVNLESSLLRLGFVLKSTSPVVWMDEDTIADAFCANLAFPKEMS